MEPLTTLSAGLSAFRNAWDLARAAIGARDEAKIAEATQELNVKIFDVQNAALHLQEKASAMRDEIESLKYEKRELNTRVAELEQRKAEREQYRLHELSPGAFVLARVESSNDCGPMHYICQSCMDNASKKVVLQEVTRAAVKENRIYLQCNECDALFFTGRANPRNRNVHAFR